MVLKNCLQNLTDDVTLGSIKTSRSKPHQDYGTENATPTKPKTVIDYDPYDYGNQHYPTLFWGPVIHFFKAVVGTGILALPYTFGSVGYAIAVPGAILTGLLYIHIVHVLLHVEYELCKTLKTPNLTYIAVVRHSFEGGPHLVRRFTSSAIFLMYFQYVVNGSMGNAVYLITIADNFKMIVDHFYGTDSNVIVILTMVTVPLLMLGLIRNLKFLVPMSTITNLFNFVNIFLILYISSTNTTPQAPKAINDVFQFPTFFGIVIGALTGTGLVLPLKNDMKNPRKFGAFFGVLNIALVAATSLYVIFGLLGYLKYADQTQPNILSNLSMQSNLSLLVLVLYSTAICVSYTLFVYIAFDTIWSNLYHSTLAGMKHRVLLEYSLRIILSVSPYLIAVAVPNFQILVSVCGVFGILIEIAFPSFIHILVLTKHGHKSATTYAIILKDLFIIALALFLFVGGVINVIDTIEQFLHGLHAA